MIHPVHFTSLHFTSLLPRLEKRKGKGKGIEQLKDPLPH